MTDAPADFEADLRPEGSDGRYELTVPSPYQGREGQPFGGVTAAVAVRAAGLEAEQPRPSSLSLHYVRPVPVETPLEIRVEPLKQGRRSEVRRVTVERDGKVAVHAIVIGTAEGEVGKPLVFEPRRRPTLPVADDLPRMADVIAETGFTIRDDHNIRTSDARVLRDPDARAAVAPDHDQRFIWAASYGVDGPSDDPWVEASRVAVMCDSHGTLQRSGSAGDVSTPFPSRDSGIGGTVNLDLTVHFHHRPRPTRWLWSEGEASVAADGLANGSCTVWSADGDVLATAVTQVMVLPAP